MFKSLSLHGWRQFRRVEINFHPRLTVLTGANGAGKTTLLNLVSRHFGWNSPFISTPKVRGKSAHLSYSTDWWDLEEPELHSMFDDQSAPMQSQPGDSHHQIGEIAYGNDAKALLLVPKDNAGVVYDVAVQGQQYVDGLHIPSHRATYSLQQVQSIPTVPRRRNEAFQQYLQIIRTRLSGGHTQWSPQYYMKETLIALATFGYGNQAVEADPESAKIFEDFQKVLRRMLPPKLGFKRLVVRVPEVVLETESGQLSIDAVSGTKKRQMGHQVQLSR